MSTSLAITTADYQSGKLQQMTFTGVNPDAKNSALQTFAEMTAALSKDSFVKAVRVDQKDLNLTRSARNISNVRMRVASGAYVTFSTEDGTNFTCDLNVSDVPNGGTYLGVYSPSDFAGDNVFPTITGINYSSVAQYAGNRFEIGISMQKIAQVLKVDVSFRETDTLLAKTIKITINITEG